ncbi:MAG: pitrilysin family protein [bacterium]|nr:pitrilysin family protein [bacterium]
MLFSKTILPNGLRLITVPMQDNPTVTVMVLVEAGSKYETKEISGISHFLEHMCFKGTVKRPKAIDIVKELDGIGAQYNAFTSQEMTGYYAKSDRRHFGKILDVVSDIYLHSTFPGEELEKEKGVIVEEIKMYQDLPPRHIHDILLELLYADQPAGWDIAGTPDTVRTTTREGILKYRSEHYVAPATAVIVAGNFEEAAAKKALTEAFSYMPTGKKHRKLKVKEVQKKPGLAIKAKKTDQVHVAFGIRTQDIYDKRNPALRVATALLGGGMSSRLFQKMREGLGICYYIGASTEHFTDHGFLEITAGVPAHRLSEAIIAILEEVRVLKSNSITLSELEHAKEYLVGNLYLGLESSDSVGDFYGAQEILHRPVLTPKEAADAVRAVTKEEVSIVCKKYFTDSRLNLALIGPVEDEAAIAKLLTLDS